MKKTTFLFLGVSLVLTALTVQAENAVNTFVHDPEQLIFTAWYYDSEGEKAISPSLGYAGRTDIYEHLQVADSYFEQVMEMYMDPEGTLMTGPKGYAKKTTDYILNENDYPCSYLFGQGDPNGSICGFTHHYFDENDNPVMIPNEEKSEGLQYYDVIDSRGTTHLINNYLFGEGGYASMSVSMSKNDEDFVERHSYFDTDGKPVLRDGVYAAYEEWYNPYKKEKRFYGTEGELVDTPLGYACEIETDTADHNETVTRYYDAGNHPTTDVQWGVHAIHIYRNSRWYITRIDYLDTEDNLTNNNKGYSTVIYDYAKYKFLPMIKSDDPVNTIYYDKDGNKVEINE